LSNDIKAAHLTYMFEGGLRKEEATHNIGKAEEIGVNPNTIDNLSQNKSEALCRDKMSHDEADGNKTCPPIY